AAPQEAVVPDPVEPVWQDVHEEAADKLVRLKRHGLVAAGPLDPVVLVPERDAGRVGGEERYRRDSRSQSPACGRAGQQWNAHYDERCFLPIHVYDAATGAPVTVILRPGKTPSGVEVRKLLSRLSGRTRRHWPNTHITIRGDGHYGREEAMTWCENYGIDYIFGLSGNVVLDRLVDAAVDDIRVRRAVNQAEVLRGFAETRYAAKSWDKERRVVARIEASASHADDMLRRGIDIRYVVTSLQGSDAEHIYETIYCARGQAENLIKQHKAQLASDRTSCRSPLANQMRLILHTGAYWLLLDLRAAIPSWNPLRHAEFAT